MNTIKIDAFATLDLRLWRSFGRLGLKVDVQNIMNNVVLAAKGLINFGGFSRIEIVYNF